MPSEAERENLWSASSDEGVDQESFNGLDLAEAPTAPARLEDQGDAMRGENNPAPRASRTGNAKAEAAGAATPKRRGRGGRPRVTAEQDQKIVEVFEKAKKEGRSLKEAAQQLADELGQPAEYINQRYYYLQRRQAAGAERPAAAAAGARRRTRGGAPAAQAATPAAAAGRRRSRAAAAAPEAAPVASGVEQRLAELSDIATRQLGALTERIERIEQRLSSLERAPRRGEAAPAGDDELYSRLGRMLVRAAFGALEQGR